MKLSIIVPVYNVRPYLTDCIESLVNQTITDFEVILIDDGSSDGSDLIVKEYAEKYPDIIRYKLIENGGQGRARNFGIEMAKGEYLGFVDSDDWIAPDMYEKLCRKADETNADVVVCDFLERFSDGRENYLKAALQDNRLASAGSACNKIFKATAVGNVRFPSGLWYEDFYFSAMLLIRSSHTEFIAEPLYIYRRGQESTMHNNNAAKNLDIITIMDMLGEYMLPNGMINDFEFLLINHIGIDTINRLASQSEPDRSVINVLQKYMQKNIPNLQSSQAFCKETFNRRLICHLNCKGFESISQFILKLKNAYKKT